METVVSLPATTGNRNSASKISAEPTVSPSLRALASAWQGPGEKIPQAMAGEITKTLPALRGSLVPAGRDALAVAAANMLAVLRGFGVPIPDTKTVAGAYAAVLAEYPADLAMRAFDSVLADHKYGMRPPLPAELAENVRDEFYARRSLLAKLEMMHRAPVEVVGPRARDDDKVKVASAVADALRALRAP